MWLLHFPLRFTAEPFGGVAFWAGNLNPSKLTVETASKVGDAYVTKCECITENQFVC